MDLLRASFEAQFGTEWSAPVAGNRQSSSSIPSVSECCSAENLDSEDGGGDSELGDEEEEGSGSDEGPITVQHTEIGRSTMEDKASRRRYMASGAPKDASASKPVSKETASDEEDLANDLALQRLIDESHILAQTQDFSGADLSLADPTEHIGKRRIQVMQSRLERAGAKITKQKAPMLIAQGMKAKAMERKQQQAVFDREGGVVTAKEQKAKKKRVNDRGLKINTVGKATAHGIEVSKRDIARIQAKSRRKKR